jgi:membrane associated rhomboid family serine protease
MSRAATPSQPAPGGQINAFEAILRMCAAAAPKPWFPRAYAQAVGMKPDRLYQLIEHLWLDGLVEKAEGAPETGPGLTLTQAGRDVLDDPATLQRLKEGRAVKPGDRGGIVREVVRRQERPVVSRVLVAANIAWFVYSIFLASSSTDSLISFLSSGLLGGGDLNEVLARSGAISGPLAVQGQWWRLATSCFVHIGLLHIAMNMNCLLQLGKVAEQMWGRVRFLVIYALAGLGGSVVGVGLMPQGLLAGASGAICGVIAAEAVWVLCNGHLLPRGVASRWRMNLLTNAFLLVLISMIPHVSWQGHLGGALTGAFVALVMQVQRFGPSPWRWAALLALLPLPWLGYVFIQHERAVNPDWAGMKADEVSEDKERQQFNADLAGRVGKEPKKAYDAFLKERGILNFPPGQRDAAEAERVKQMLGEQRETVKQLADDLARAGPYKSERVEKARQAGIAFTDAVNDLLATAERRLRAGEEWTAEDRAKIQKAKDAYQNWGDALK